MADDGGKEPVRIGGDWYLMFANGGSDEYYANSETNEVQWTFPEELMKGDWVRVWNEEHERDYWTNSRTGESQWTEPETASDRLTSDSEGGSASESAGGEDGTRDRTASTLIVNNPMTGARAARTARKAATGGGEGDVELTATKAPAAPAAPSTTHSAAAGRKEGDKKATPVAPVAKGDSKAAPGRQGLTVKVTAPATSRAGAGKGGGSPGGAGASVRNPLRAAAGTGAGGSSPAGNVSPLRKGGSSKGSSSKLGGGSKKGGAGKKKHKGPSYKARRRKRDQWRAQPCSNLQQAMYTLTIFGVSFTTQQSVMRGALLVVIFLGFGEAMMETYDSRPALALLILAESLYVTVFTLEYAARLWSCHPLAFEEHDGTVEQRRAQASANALKGTWYWLLYVLAWPLHVGGMLCNADPAAKEEAGFRWRVCLGCSADVRKQRQLADMDRRRERERKSKAVLSDPHEAWAKPLPHLLGCLPGSQYVAAAGPFWQRLQFALRWPSLFDLAQLLPLFLYGVAPDQVALFAQTADITYVGAAFRFIRVMRVVKMVRYIPTMHKLIAGISGVKKDLVTATTAGVIVALLLAAAAHAAEQHENATFSSIPKALWGMIITLTTVGYGDVFPTSKEGKMISSVAAIAGIGLFTIPAATIARGFREYAEREQERRADAVARLLKLYRTKKLRTAWAKWLRQAQLLAMGDRMADPNSRKAQRFKRRKTARDLLRLCALELGTCLETVSKAVSERQATGGMGFMPLGMEVGGGVDSPQFGPASTPGSPRRSVMGSPRRTSAAVGGSLF